MGDKTFNLTWNNHLANLSGLFEGLYKSGALTDTTLACQGGSLRAHRLVLAACSPFFERVFKEHYGDQPILILKSVTVEEMECLLDFMYRGSIDVSEEHLGSLIKTATDLEIRGLSGDCGSDIRSPYTRTQKSSGSESRRHSGEYQKENSIFQSNQSSRLNLLNAQIKMEEIEVEDDPMVMESHESNFEQTLMSTEENKSTPTLYNRETRYKGQKRVAVGRPVRSSQDQSRNESSMGSDLKELNFNGAITDPTVPAIQMNEEEPDQDENVDSPRIMEEPTEEKSTIKISSVRGAAYSSDASKPAGKNQYKPFPCDLCTLSFTRASHLARHRRVHTGERPFACSICPRMFARQDKLKQHLDSHLQWPKQKSNESKSQSVSAPSVPGKAKRGRPRKIQVSLEQSAMEEIMKFGEFSSMLNKSQSYNVKIGPSEGANENKTSDNNEQSRDESTAGVDNNEEAV